MDFFYMTDLCKLVDYYICDSNKNLPKLSECRYKDKCLLSDIANIINSLSTYKVPIIIEKEGLAQEYIGCSSIDIHFEGLAKGIELTYNQLKKLF
jgi:hypothetical protein